MRMNRGRAPGKPAPRRPNRRRPNYLSAVRNVVAALAVLQLMQAAFASPRLAVRAVRVTGASRVSAERILGLARVRPGTNIFRLNLYRARQAVLQEPVIREAAVTRSLPDTILIHVVERSPRLTARTDNRYWEVDEDGVAFRLRDDPVPGLPVLQLSGGEALVPGTVVPAAIWRATRDCMKLLAGRRIPLRTILFDAQGELWLNIAVSGSEPGGERVLPVRLGRPEDLEQKLSQLPLVLPVASVDGKYLDLMCSGRAAYRKTGDQAGSAGPDTIRPESDAAREPALEPGDSRWTGSSEPDRTHPRGQGRDGSPADAPGEPAGAGVATGPDLRAEPAIPGTEGRSGTLPNGSTAGRTRRPSE